MDSKNSELWQSRVSRTVNSAACFSLAYVILTYLLWLITGLAGRFYKFDSFVYYYGIKFMLNSQAWTKTKVIFVYCAGPFSMLFIALIGLFLYSRLKKTKSILNLFFLWIFIIGISIFISELIIAGVGMYKYTSLYYQSLAVSFSWMGLPKFLVYFMDLMMLILVVYFGVNSGRLFMVFSFSYSKVNTLSRRRKYFFETALAPFVLGIFVTCVAVFPKEVTAKNVLVLMAASHIIYIAIIGAIIGIGWMSLSYIEVSKSDLARYKSLQMPNFIMILFMAISWAFIYITLRGVYLN